MSSRNHHSSSTGSRKRDRSTEDRRTGSSHTGGHKSDKDRDRHDKTRDPHPSHSRHDSSPKRHSSSHHRHDEDDDRVGRSSSKKSKVDDRYRDKDQDRDRDSRKSSRHESAKGKDDKKGKERKRERHHRSSKRHDSDESEDTGSGSNSESQSGSENDSKSEDDEMIRKAKSMIQTITETDYFTKSAEFRLWMRQDKKKYFEDLSADEARRYFRKFVRSWNNYELGESYYRGIRSSQLSHKDTTKYQWGFARKIGKEDQEKAESIRDSIDTMTNVRFAQEVSRLTGKTRASDPIDGSSAPRRTLGPTMPPYTSTLGPSRKPMTADEGNIGRLSSTVHENMRPVSTIWSILKIFQSSAILVVEKEEYDQSRRLQERAEQKAFQKSNEVSLEELVPKASGREAMLEKKRAKNDYHRRERSPDVELTEQDIMGTGDDYKSMLAAEKRRREAKESRRHGGIGTDTSSGGLSGSSRGSVPSSVTGAKQQAYKEKEEKQLEAFRQLWAQTQAAKGL
ncbi:hypothetical protein BGZ65_005739 [Modicella reniformis]|uniref:Uncharacterized protein n=1 Tax=Modicella reniformis TaxID=1440133 RepID=A0A9P6JLM6_9FUNG|nr:hypothetical protein BGZ65_005739 [Modicella reniformis]